MKNPPALSALFKYLASSGSVLDDYQYLIELERIWRWGEVNALKSHFRRPWANSFEVICSFDTDIPF